MPHYKDPEGTLHFLEDESFAYLLPAGSVQLSEAEELEIQQPSLEDVKTLQVALLNEACGGAITSGFESSALGTVHIYSSQETDQANLAANVLSSFYPNLPADWVTPQLCQDADGTWAYRPHTAAQIQQVGLDGKAAILTNLQRCEGLRRKVETAKDAGAVEAVTW